MLIKYNDGSKVKKTFNDIEKVTEFLIKNGVNSDFAHKRIRIELGGRTLYGTVAELRLFESSVLFPEWKNAVKCVYASDQFESYEEYEIAQINRDAARKAWKALDAFLDCLGVPDIFE